MSMVLEHVNYFYGIGTGEQVHALKDICLEIHDNEFIGLVGHSGSGKSTLIQLFNGLEKPNSGTITYEGENILASDFSKRLLRQKVGLVFQYPEHQLFEETVIKDVQFGPRNMGLDNLQVELRSFEALKQVGIGEDLLDVSPLGLSGGQKRRVAIAGVLAMQPDILILDEPMAGLDPVGREEILQLLVQIQRQRKITVILVSHSMDDVAEYAHRILVMNEGQLVLDGKPDQIFHYEQELVSIGLGVPQTTSLLHELEKKSQQKVTEQFTVDSCVESIIEWIES